MEEDLLKKCIQWHNIFVSRTLRCAVVFCLKIFTKWDPRLIQSIRLMSVEYRYCVQTIFLGSSSVGKSLSYAQQNIPRQKRVVNVPEYYYSEIRLWFEELRSKYGKQA